MAELNILNTIGLERAISTRSLNKKITESQSVVLKTAIEFDLDYVYFNTDENLNSFPAVFLKKVETFDSNTLEKIADIQKKIWNYRKVLFLYVYNDLEIRIYSCTEKPLIKKQYDFDYEKELKSFELKSYELNDKEQLKELNNLFSSIALDTGIIWTLEEAENIRKQLNLQRRVDKYLVESLVNTADLLNKQGLEVNYIHKVILRSLFLLYLEDRGATDEQFYSKIKKGAKSYFDILDDVDATLNLFNKLEDHFNGNVFTLEVNENISKEHLQLIKKCFISGNDNTPQASLFEGWRLFDFNIIQIELLSEIYENFLFKTDPELKKQTGTYYTPPSLVEFILNEKLPIHNGENEYNVKVLDPSCGSGIFLVESFKRLVKRYENLHKNKLTDFETLKKLLIDNIYGIELHPQAIKVAAFSLYLALVDNLNPKNIWQKKKHQLPYLINNPKDKTLKEQGSNLYCRDTINDNTEIENIKFDLVIGNPPFGTNKLSDSIKEYCSKFNFAKEMVLPFLHKATKFCPNGQIALIFNTKVLTNTGGTYQNFRKWLFNDCYVEKVYNFSILRNAKKNFGGQLFGDATGPISIVYYQKEQPKNPSNKIAYYAPKTFIKSNVIEGLSIDYTDLKYLPREECQKPDTKIWKVAMWGGMHDWRLINQVYNMTFTLKEYFKDENNSWSLPKVGLNGDKENPDIKPAKVIDPKLIQRYYTDKSALKGNDKFFRKIDELTFKPPYVILKKGQFQKQLASSYIDYASYCTTACYIFNGDVLPSEKKLLVAILNSNITTYFLFLVSSSWGIEREQLFLEEILESPALFTILDKDLSEEIVQLFDNIIETKKSNSLVDFGSEIHENKINELLLNALFENDKHLKTTIDDCLNYSLDLFHKQEKSKALLPTLNTHVYDFAYLMSEELNTFLDSQDLFTNVTTYNVAHFSPLMMIKLSFHEDKREIIQSSENLHEELKKIDNFLWEQKSSSIFFRKKLNYKTGKDIYIIRPNQRRFWSKSIALEDASELILEILNED